MLECSNMCALSTYQKVPLPVTIRAFEQHVVLRTRNTISISDGALFR